MIIEINNLTAGHIDEKKIKRIAEKVLKGEKGRRKTVSIAFTGKVRIKELNRRYRKKNKATDVLSFDYRAKRSVRRGNLFFRLAALRRAKAKEENKVLFAHGDSGEIVICPEKVKENAKKYGLSFKEELVRCLIHGILHLSGYDHEKSAKEEKKMRDLQNHYLKICQKLI